MTHLKWDQSDFFYCLEVEPDIEDDGLEYHYKVKRGELYLDLTVIPYLNSVSFSLSQINEDKPLIAFLLLVAGPVSYEKDKRGEYLLFSRVKFVRHVYSDEVPESVGEGRESFDLNVEVFVKPTIRIQFDL